jgi:hypothetical protein
MHNILKSVLIEATAQVNKQMAALNRGTLDVAKREELDALRYGLGVAGR